MIIKRSALGLLTGLIFIVSMYSSVTFSRTNALATICNDPNISTAQNGASNSPYCKDTTTVDPIIGAGGENIIVKVTNLLEIIIGIVAVIYMIVAGLQIVMSGGNSEKISNARDRIIYASVGLLIIAIAKIIISFVIFKTG